MVSEVFDDDEDMSPEQAAMFKALMGGGMLRFSPSTDGTVAVDVIPIRDIYPEPPKDVQ
jgi:hypothetical protein